MPDWMITYLRDLLREDPDNPHLKSLIKIERRRIEAQGTRGKPPARTLDRARERLLTAQLIETNSPQPFTATLPIDFEVRSLISNGVIVAQSDEDAHWCGRLSVIDGCAWADYYARIKLGREPSRRAAAKLALQDSKILGEALADYLYAHSNTLVSGTFSTDGFHLTNQVNALRQAQSALEEILGELKPAAADKGGRPGDPWRIGFVFGMSHRWTTLTKYKIADSDRFLSFVSQGAASIDEGPRSNSDSWSSAIRTAIATFGLTEDGRGWISQPGDQPQTTKPTP